MIHAEERRTPVLDDKGLRPVVQKCKVRVEARGEPDRRLRFPHGDRLAEYQISPVFLECFIELLEPIGERAGVIVGEGDEVAASGGDTRVESKRVPQSRLADVADFKGGFCRKSLHDFGGSVGRGVIDYEGFNGRTVRDLQSADSLQARAAKRRRGCGYKSERCKA